jgi:hypothetical protein
LSESTKLKMVSLRKILKEKVRVKRINNQSQIVLRNTWQSSELITYKEQKDIMRDLCGFLYPKA